MPYAILASSLPQRKLGIYMGLFNIFVVVPQLLVATVMGSIMKRFFPGEPIWTSPPSPCCASRTRSGSSRAERRPALTHLPRGTRRYAPPYFGDAILIRISFATSGTQY